MDSINSFATLAEKITILNKNCVEILTKVNDLVASQEDSVVIAYDDNGAVGSFSQPTVGYLKNQIDVLNQNMKRMASIDGYTFVRDGQSYKRIMTSDLNREPAPIQDINQVTTFTPVNNHFFESLMNPMLAVTIDLTDKVEQIVNKVLSRRYIIRFEKNADGSLTENGLRSFNSFSTTFLNKTGINITDFIAWYDNPSNNGLVIDTVKPYDEQIYDLALKSLQYYGVFSVIKVEIDDINNKMWYHLNDTRYYGNDGTIKKLAIGDELIVNKLNAGTRYLIKEVNTDSSNMKVRLENIEGYDPVVVGTNVLKYYSDISNQKTVQINVGFDEYIVQFVKPINTDDNIVGNLWSKGISFYTNDLILDINNNINLSNYYVQAVYDYGTLLRDMISKQMPTIYGETPNTPVLNPDNFKVVQINKHLTDDKDQNALLKAHSDKSTVKTQISQINAAITQKTSKLNAGGLTTTEKQTYLNEINKLKTDLNISTNNLSSLITQITELNTGGNTKVEPKYRVRGFWPIPEPIVSSKTSPQHVVQFRIEYRYSSKSGNSNNIQTFNYIDSQPSTITQSRTTGTSPTIRTGIGSASQTGGGTVIAATVTNQNTASSIPSTNVGKTMPVQSTDVSTTTENPANGPKLAYFSNWIPLMSDVRKRYWDENSKQWYWKIEDVSDAETPNINQLDIPIQQNERVEIRVKSISEVGWPDSLIESDWSNVLTMDFPDDLNNILADNEFILAEATQDKTAVVLESTLSSKGVNKHLEDSFNVNQDYVAHKDTSIQVSIRTDQSQNMNLFQYLTYLTNRIATLEQQVASAKGTLNVSLYKNNTLLKTIGNNSNTIVNIECEDYGTSYSTGDRTGSQIRTYLNTVNIIEDYVIALENTNQSGNLGFLSNRTFTTGGTNAFYTDLNHKVLLVDYNSNLYTQNDNQYLWFADRDNNDWLSTGVTSFSDYPVYLSHASYNLGATGSTTPSTPMNKVYDLFGDGTNQDDLMCAVFPYLPDISDFIENGQDKTKLVKPQTKINIGLKIYFKFSGTGTTNDIYVAGTGTSSTKSRKIKFWFETNDNTTYQFVINFNLNRFRNYMRPKGSSLV